VDAAEREVLELAVGVPEAGPLPDRAQVGLPALRAVLGAAHLGPRDGAVPDVAVDAGMALREGPRLGEELHDELLGEVGAHLLRRADEGVGGGGVPAGAQRVDRLGRDERREHPPLADVVEEATR
jgi:hypothetical protein